MTRSRFALAYPAILALALAWAASTASFAQATPRPEREGPPAAAAYEVTQATPAAQPTPPSLPPAPAANPGAPRVPRPAIAPRAPRPPRAPRLAGGYLGVELVDLTPELRAHFGAPREVGVMIGHVEPESPAARAGLEVADIVIGIGDEPVHDSWGFSSAVSNREGGEAIDLKLVRDRGERRVGVTLERRERAAVDVGRWIFPRTPPPDGGGPTPEAAVPLPEMGPALERLGRLLERPDFDERLRAAQQRIDSEVERKMRELEARLQDLERRLQESERRR